MYVASPLLNLLPWDRSAGGGQPVEVVTVHQPRLAHRGRPRLAGAGHQGDPVAGRDPGRQQPGGQRGDLVGEVPRGHYLAENRPVTALLGLAGTSGRQIIQEGFAERGLGDNTSARRRRGVAPAVFP